MRFMMLMIPHVYQGGNGKNLSDDFSPGPEDVERMTKFNERLAKAGALMSLDGLQPLTKGARISFAGGKPRVVEGSIAESKEVLGGYWMINVKSKEEAIAWAKKCPASSNETIEIRRVFEMDDFPQDVKDAAGNFQELQKSLNR